MCVCTGASPVSQELLLHVILGTSLCHTFSEVSRVKLSSCPPRSPPRTPEDVSLSSGVEVVSLPSEVSSRDTQAVCLLQHLPSLGPVPRLCWGLGSSGGSP